MKTLIVGEIGINHNSDLNIAKQLIDLCSELKIPYVKFQKRFIEDIYTKEFLDSYRESPWGITQKDQKEGLEFNLEQYQEIDRYCKEKGNIQWFASPWDLKSIDFLVLNFPDIPFIKIPSAKITDKKFMDACRKTYQNLIVSTGMCDLEMIKKAICGNEYIRYILGCTSSYPTPIKDVNLNQMKILNYYFCNSYIHIGWSDHTGTVLFPALAVSHGAKMIEVHITLDRKMYGSDQVSSLEPEGLRHLVKYIEAIELGMGESEKKIMESEILVIKKLRG